MPDPSDIARSTIEKHDLLPEGAVVLVMLSGGADSVGLLRLLTSGEILGELRITALHVNHLLRAEESDADEAFVRELCTGLGVPLHVERVDVAARARESGENLEDAGRKVRYALAEAHLDAACDEAGVPRPLGRIAVAHTRDDRTETHLMRLAQGAGAGGLTAMKPARGRIVRPLIELGRDELRNYLGSLGQDWREDSSNTDTSRVRARIRHEILPVMRSINGRFDESLARMLEVLAEEDALLSEMAEAFARDFARTSGERVEFECSMMATLSLPMKRRTVRAAVLGAFPEASRLEFEHVEALVEGLAADGFARDLPEGLRAENRYGTMTVSRRGTGRLSVAPGLLSVPGTVDLGPAGTLRADPTAPEARDEGPDVAVIDAACLSGEPLTVDAPREGDRMRPLGMEGSKKVSDLLIDAKVPRGSREGTPVVRDGDQIVWIAGVRMSEPYKVTPATRSAVRLRWYRHPDVAVGDEERTETTDAS